MHACVQDRRTQTHYPYSVFTVVETKWVEDLNEYHELTIKAATDNQLHPEDLPLAPWF